MKKILVLLLAFILVFTLFSCDNNEEEKVVPMNELYLNMLNVADFKEMEYFDSGDVNSDVIFENVSELEYNKVEEFFITNAKEKKGNADEIIVIHLKKNSYVDDCFDDLQSHWNQRLTNYQNYDPSEVDKIEDGELFKYENYVCLIISDNASSIKEAFINSFN